LKQRARELRGKQTDAEALLWDLLRDRQLSDLKFRRQHQFGDYICDFYCHEAKLVVECDGDVHQTAERRQLDAKRDTYLKSQGLTVLRFQNAQILQDPEPVLEAIAQHLLPPSPSSSPAGRGQGEGGSHGRGAGGEGGVPGDLLTPDERGRLAKNFRGYDISPDMVRLSLVNLYLHGFADPHIYEYDTLTSEERWNEFADVILANPPFMSPKGGIKPHKRFSIQAKRSEVLFVDYMAEHLTPTGRAGIIVPEGIIFQSQTAYKDLRKMLVENSLVAVVSLPAGCFNPYSGVKTSILILDKSLAKAADTIAFFKVENDGFGLGAQRRAFDKNDLPQVQAELARFLHALRSHAPMEPFPAGRGQGEGAQLCCGLIVPKDKIAANGDYNLSGERYREGAVSNTAYPLVPVRRFMKEGVKTVDPRATPDELFELWSIPAFDAGKPELLRGGEIGSQKKLVAPGDVLLSRIIPHIRRGWVVHENTDGRRQIASTEWIVFSSSEVVPGFLRQLLVSDFFHGSFMQTITGVGGSLARANPAAVGEIQIPLPPLEVQKEIVAEIEGYQKVINGARAVLDHYRPHIPIHPDWPMVKLGEVSEVTSSKRILAEEYVPSGTPFYRTKEIVELSKGHEISLELFIPRERYESIKARFGAPAKGDLLVSAVGTIGISWVVSDDREFYFKDGNLLWIRSLSNLDPNFLKHCLDSTFAEGIDHIVFGAAYKALTIEKLKEFKIPLPPLATQQAIVAEIEAEQALVAANRELITRFEQKIQATLARIWGKVEG
jgi:type I restriction enzyme M protein